MGSIEKKNINTVWNISWEVLDSQLQISDGNNETSLTLWYAIVCEKWWKIGIYDGNTRSVRSFVDYFWYIPTWLTNNPYIMAHDSDVPEYWMQVRGDVYRVLNPVYVWGWEVFITSPY